MDQIYVGNEVLIFELDNDGKEYNDKFVKGKVTKIIIKNKGLDNQEFEYEVLGENKKTYIGCYGYPRNGNVYFRTREYHIAYLQKKIDLNNKLIYKCNQINNDNIKTIKYIVGNEEEFSLSVEEFINLFIGIYKLTGKSQLNLTQLEQFIFDCKFNKKYNEFLDKISFLDNFKDFFNLENQHFDDDIIINLPHTDIESLVVNNLPYINKMAEFMKEFNNFQISKSQNITQTK